MKNTLLIMSALIPILAIQSVQATILASGNPDDGNGCGANCSWSLDDNGVLTISGTGNMVDHMGSNGDNQPWLDYRSDIQKVVVKSGITSVSTHAFRNISTLTEVSLPNGLISVGRYAFLSTGLTSVTIPSSVNSLGYTAFGTGTLKSVTFEEPSHLTSLGEAFVLSGLTSIKIPEGVTSLGWEEFNATYNSIKSITIPDSVTYISSPYAVYMVTQVNDFTANAANLARFLEAGGGFMAGSDGKINVTCTSGDCDKYLRTESKYKDNQSMLNAIYCSVANADGSTTIYNNGKIISIKGKRIYTVQEANQVSKPTGNRVSIRYK